MRKAGLAMNGKALAEMWSNMDEEGKKLYKEEEEEGKKKLSWGIFYDFWNNQIIIIN